jgi:hypothetical protein
MKITFEGMYSHSPCDPYQTEKMKAVFQEYLKDGKTALEILEDSNFPHVEGRNQIEDKFWLVSWFLSDKTNRLAAVAFNREIWDLLNKDCQETVLIAERYAHGNATDEELASVRARAWASACARIKANAWSTASVWANAWKRNLEIFIQIIKTYE